MPGLHLTFQTCQPLFQLFILSSKKQVIAFLILMIQLFLSLTDELISIRPFLLPLLHHDLVLQCTLIDHGADAVGLILFGCGLGLLQTPQHLFQLLMDDYETSFKNQSGLLSLLTSSYTSVLSLENSQGSSFSCSSSLVLIILSSRLRSTPSSGAGRVLLRVSICISQKSTSFSTQSPMGLLTSACIASVSASMSGTTITFSLATSQKASFFFQTTWLVAIRTLLSLEKPQPWFMAI